MNKALAIVIAGVVLAAVALGAAMLAYSYSQVSVSLGNVEFHSIEWDITVSNLLSLGAKALTGDYIGSALALIQEINLNLVFELSNGGILPVYIPHVTYDLVVNDVPVGQASSSVSATIGPGQTKQIAVVQNVKKSSLEPAIRSIIDSAGIMDIKARGTAYFGLEGLQIPVTFELSRQISIIDEIEKKLSQNAQDTSITLHVSESEARQGTAVQISGRLATDDGHALGNMMVHIKDEDTGTGDDDIAKVHTDARGEFSYLWFAKTMDLWDDTVEIYVVFEGGNGFERARSAQHVITVVDEREGTDTQRPQQGASSLTRISLDVSHTLASEGDVIFISGRLLDARGDGIQNALIYIKDEDTGTGDDDIAKVYTDARGEFSYLWFARTMDPWNDTVEIYAVFEGSSDFGGSRSDQISVQVR